MVKFYFPEIEKNLPEIPDRYRKERECVCVCVCVCACVCLESDRDKSIFVIVVILFPQSFDVLSQSYLICKYICA